MDLRELNHILIPPWEKLEKKRAYQVAFRLVTATTPEGRALLVLLLLTGVAGIDVRFSALYLVFCALAGLALSALLLRPLARVKGLELSLTGPAMVSANAAATFTLKLTNRGLKPLYALRISGPFLPWDGRWISSAPVIPRLNPGESAEVQSQLSLSCRGARVLGPFTVVSVFPLGLLAGNPVVSTPARLLVVPAPEAIAGLPDPPSILEPPDQRGRLFVAGESYELLGLRPYRAGDRLKDLHARSSARYGVPMVREYRRAARRRVVVHLDGVGRPKDRAQADRAAGLAAGLVAWGLGADALVDLHLGGLRPRTVVVGAHLAGLELALTALSTYTPSPEADDLEPLLGQLLPLSGVRGESGGLLCLVLLGFGPHQEALFMRAKAHAPALIGLVVASGGAQAEAARSLGLRVYAPTGATT